MKTSLRGIAKSFALSIFAIAVLALGQGVALAQGEVTFTGTATGTLTGVTNVTFSPSTFNETTDNGFVAFGGDPVPGLNFNNFGSLTQTPGSTSVVSTGANLALTLTFSAPQGISGGQAQEFTAVVTGGIAADGRGGLLFDFDPTSASRTATRTFTFVNTNGQSGTFTLNVNGLSLNSGQTASITGDITASAVPEPATMLLLGTGLVGIAGVARRRMKNGRSSDEV